MKESRGCLATSIIAFLVFVFGGCIALTAIDYQDEHWETITVIDKTISVDSRQDSYLVYTENETYMIQDLFWCGFFRTSDIYRQVQVGGTYRVKVKGKRVPIFSSYKNIIEAYKME